MEPNPPSEQVDPLLGLPARTVGGQWMPAGGFVSAGRAPRLFSSGGGRRTTAMSSVGTGLVVGILATMFPPAPGSMAFEATFLRPADQWRSCIGNPDKGHYYVCSGI